MLTMVNATRMDLVASTNRLVEVTATSIDNDNWRLWIAINQALAGVDDWREEYNRCAFVELERGRALVMEAIGDTHVCVSHRRLNWQGDLEDVTVWSLILDDDGVRDVSMDGAPADGRCVEALTSLFWFFHRLAVEDRAAMHRS